MDIGLGVLERFPSSRVDARGFLKMCRRLGRVLGSGGWARYGGDCAEDLGAERRWGGGGVRAGAGRGPVVSVSGASGWGGVLFTSLVLAFSGLDVNLVRGRVCR